MKRTRSPQRCSACATILGLRSIPITSAPWSASHSHGPPTHTLRQARRRLAVATESQTARRAAQANRSTDLRQWRPTRPRQVGHTPLGFQSDGSPARSHLGVPSNVDRRRSDRASAATRGSTTRLGLRRLSPWQPDREPVSTTGESRAAGRAGAGGYRAPRRSTPAARHRTDANRRAVSAPPSPPPGTPAARKPGSPRSRHHAFPPAQTHRATVVDSRYHAHARELGHLPSLRMEALGLGVIAKILAMPYLAELQHSS